MKIAALIARILLGLIFLVFGLNGFLHFIPQPPMPPSDATTFIGIFIKSGFYVPTFVCQVAGGALLLAGRFVPLGLVLLGPVLVNILTFHLTLMRGQGIALGLIATVLWLIVFAAYRQYFTSLFVSNAKPS